MTTHHQVRMSDTCVISPTFLFRWEESQDAHVLLYPEGIVKLNETGGTILKHCDGESTVAELVDKLNERYNTDREAITQGVIKFLEVSHAKGWIRVTS
ncbi:pyrroloquinoline quinone biosynthesis peptide chaperone PqqD [Halomonas sp. EGI 63088]|uniref:Pyrroloquinoline quinone biosynthesis peptide chaperone PqqD n=1 Tax=Halomonas flagellata TaxID=2920385 RepID=A0ABS9RXD5_9GAMM|nr:pyrroloquinoline quinone biosynthesis peptide chaperone PqqD [Halomonas flagellata]MCH4564523.1 pyrroloquinoline quinone biosynthesis peptide chaperone PqqD [Halomonas flagellata]